MATTPTPKPQNLLGVDAYTRTARTLYTHLRRLKSTVSIAKPDPYREYPSFCQIRINTTMTEAELNNWLWKTKHSADYVDTFTW